MSFNADITISVVNLAKHAPSVVSALACAYVLGRMVRNGQLSGFILRATYFLGRVVGMYEAILKQFMLDIYAKPPTFPVTTSPSAFLLDLMLPIERAEDAYNLLLDKFEERWLKKYTRRQAKFLFYWHSVSIIFSHHSSRVCRLFGLICGALGLSKLRDWAAKFL